MRAATAIAAPLLALWVSAPAAAEGGTAARVWLEPPVVVIDANGQGRAVLHVENVGEPGVAAFQVVLGFDPEVATVRDPNREVVAFGGKAFAPLGGSLLCAVARGGSSCPDPTWMLTSTGRSALGGAIVDEQAGTVSIGYGTIGDEGLPVGGGALAVLEMVGVPGVAAELQLLDVMLVDASEPPRRHDVEAAP